MARPRCHWVLGVLRCSLVPRTDQVTKTTVLLCAALCAALWWGGCQDRRLVSEREARKAFEARAQSAEHIADQYRRYATVDSLESVKAERIATARRDSLRWLRASAAVTGARLDSALRDTPKPTDANGKLYLTIAQHFQRLVDTLEVVLALADSAHAADSVALDRERAAHRWTRMARDSLAAALASRPKPPKPWWLAGVVPRVQVGYGATLTDGVVRAGPSVNLGWRVNF